MASPDDDSNQDSATVADPEVAEPRVRDLLRSAPNIPDVTANLDAKTQADLARWFGLPSIDSSQAPTLSASNSELDEDPEQAEARKRRDAAMAAADPRFLDKVFGWFDRADALTFDESAGLALQVRHSKDVTIAGDFSSTVVVGKVVDRELPYGVEGNLRDCAPQALLRDLYRPEMFFRKEFELLPLVDQHPTERLIKLDPVPPAVDSFLRTTNDVAMSLTWLRELHDIPWSKLPLKRPVGDVL
jgi:hypothetical protein